MGIMWRKMGNISTQKHDSKDPDTDGSLNQWICIVIGQGMHFSNPMLKSKSRDYTKKLGHWVFKAKRLVVLMNI